MFHRSYKYLKTKKLKTFILFIFCFIILFATYISFSFSTTINNQINKIIQTNGISMLLVPNYENKDIEKSNAKGISVEPILTTNQLTNIQKSKYLSGYDYKNSSLAQVDKNKIIDTDKMISDASDKNSSTISMKIGETSSMDNLDNYKNLNKEKIVNIEGISTWKYFNYEEKIYKIVKGKPVSQASSNEIMISTYFSDLNKLDIGSSIILKNNEGKNKEFSVVGIYDSKEQDIFSKSYIANTMVMSYKEANFFLPIKLFPEKNNNIYLNKINFFASNPSNAEMFKEEWKLQKIVNNEQYVFENNDTIYNTIILPLLGLQELTNKAIIAIIAIMIIILMIILFNDSRSRKKEIGILSAIGESKLKIAIQIFIEQLYILTLAFIILLFIAVQSSEIIIQSIISSDLFAPGFSLLNENYIYTSLSLKDNFFVFLETYFFCLMLIIIVTLIPTLLTLRKSTTQILSDNS